MTYLMLVAADAQDVVVEAALVSMEVAQFIPLALIACTHWDLGRKAEIQMVPLHLLL
jgi:hypothetical protein